MKRLSVIVLIAFFIMSTGVVSAIEPSYHLKSSGKQTADATVHTGKCLFAGILIISDGSNNAKVVVYDNTSAAGTALWETTITGSNYYGGGIFPHPIYCVNGIYADVTGTNAAYIIFYTTPF